MAFDLNASFPQLSEIVTRWRYYLWPAAAVGFCLIVGLWLGYAKSGAIQNATASKDIWKLPQVRQLPPAPVMNPDDVADLFWSDEPRAKRNVVPVKKAPVANWRLMGTFTQGQFLYGIVADDKRVVTVKAGDALPDGAVIRDVQEGLLSFEQDGSTKTRRLFDKDAPK